MNFDYKITVRRLVWWTFFGLFKKTYRARAHSCFYDVGFLQIDRHDGRIVMLPGITQLQITYSKELTEQKIKQAEIEAKQKLVVQNVE